jgi:hypothetical protein
MLVATSLSSLVQSPDHAQLYSCYKLAFDPSPYLPANRDANRPSMWAVRGRAKFNAVVGHLDTVLASSSGDDVSAVCKASYVALAREIYSRSPNAKADILDEYPLPTSSFSRDPLDIGPSVPVFKDEVVDESSVTARIKALDVQHLRGRPAAGFLTGES